MMAGRGDLVEGGVGCRTVREEDMVGRVEPDRDAKLFGGTREFTSCEEPAREGQPS